MSNIIEHLESHLGQLDSGWSLRDTSNAIQVARFLEQPFEKTVTFSTLGLSNNILPMPNGREVRQELIFSAYAKYSQEHIASFLLTFSDYVLTQHRALLRGDVVGPGLSLIQDVSVNAIYSTIPTVFNNQFSTFEGTVPPTVFVWLVPITASEAAFIKAQGWSIFEDILENHNPDLWDLDRSSVV